MPIFPFCPNCSTVKMERTESRVCILQCYHCGQRFCDACAGGPGGVVVPTLRCPRCHSDSTYKIGDTARLPSASPERATP